MGILIIFRDNIGANVDQQFWMNLSKRNVNGNWYIFCKWVFLKWFLELLLIYRYLMRRRNWVLKNAWSMCITSPVMLHRIIWFVLLVHYICLLELDQESYILKRCWWEHTFANENSVNLISFCWTRHCLPFLSLELTESLYSLLSCNWIMLFACIYRFRILESHFSWWWEIMRHWERWKSAYKRSYRFQMKSLPRLVLIFLEAQETEKTCGELYIFLYSFLAYNGFRWLAWWESAVSC